MRRLFLAVAILALAFSAIQRAEARTDISIDFFYDNLSDGGNWIEVGDYGYCWQPSVAASNPSWRPYSDGYWAYTDFGWTWISYEDFGWATYHYGRWIRLRGRGWVWVPGREWGPAWVAWRTGGDYVGWAPLPPRRAGQYWDEQPITARVDIDFDIGPAYYNFIDVRYIGEPVLRERIVAADQNVTYITKTVNVTNITYNNSAVYNYGPDYATLSRYSARPIQRLSVQRESNVDPATAAQSKSLMKVQGDKLVVAAPQQFQKPSKQAAPKVVKEKLAQAPVERGWEPVRDPKAQAELREKIKREDPKSVPPPTVQASEKSPATTAPATSAAAGASPTEPAVSPSLSAPKDKNKRNEKTSPAPSAAGSTSPALTTPTTPEKNRKKNQKVPLTTPSASVPPVSTPAPNRDKGRNKQRDNAAPNPSVPPTTDVTAAPTVAPKAPKEKNDNRRLETIAPPAPVAPKVAPPATPDSKPNKPAPDSKPEAAVDKSRHEPSADLAPKMKKDGPAANTPVNPPPARDEGKKQKKNEPAASPTP
jgi:hypothetical protein